MRLAARSGKNAGQDRMTQMQAIVEEHEAGLLRYATRILNNPWAAEDVVQNVFLKLFEGWKEGTRPSSKLRAWLYCVTHNEAVDHIRRETRLRGLHERHAADPALSGAARAASCPDGVNCEGGESDRKKLVLAHLRNLHPREQQVLLLRLEEGLTYEEIADATGRTVGNVGKLLHEAVKKLSRCLKGKGK